MATTQRRSADATRAALLDAARVRFSADGYERTTLRAVAGDVGVSAALTIRYFGSKEALFAEAADVLLDIPDLVGVGPDRLAEVLLPRFFVVWEESTTFLALLRASATSEMAAAALRRVFAQQVLPAFSSIAPDRAVERAGMAGSLMLGLALTRYVLRTPAIADMGREDLAAWVAPVLAQLLTGPAPTRGPDR